MYRYYLIANDATETEIPEPAGFDKFESVLKRSPRHGIQVEFSEAPLSFYCGEGYDEIWAEYTANGSDGSMQFKQTYECNGETEVIYQANINFNGLQHIAGESITVNLEIVGFGNLLQTREKSKIAMDADTDLDGGTITPANPETLELHSRIIKKELLAGNIGQMNTVFTIPGTEPEKTQLFAQVGWPDVTLDEIPGMFHYTLAWQGESIPANGASIIDVQESGEYAFDIEINYQLDVTVHSPGNLLKITDLEFRWILRVDDTEYPLSNTIFITGNLPDPDSDNIYRSGSITSTISTTLNLTAGQKVYLFAYQDHNYDEGTLNSDREFTLYQDSGSSINITALTQTPKNYCNAWPVSDVYRQVVYGTTGKADRFKSDYFDNCGARFSLTDGFQIRNFPGKSLTVSRDDLFAGLNPVFAIGEGLTLDGTDEIVEVEPVGYFYQSNEILRIEAPTDYLEDVAGEFIYNALEVGYEKSNTDEFNALDEFNSRREYQTPIKTHDNKFTAVSRFVASMYAIESQRRQPYVDGSRVSGDFDKDTFIISTRHITYTQDIIAIAAGAGSTSIVQLDTFPEVQTGETVQITGSGANNGSYTVVSRAAFGGDVLLTITPAVPNAADNSGNIVYAGGKVAEKDEPFDTVDNLISPETMYNGRISPARNMRRWAKVINSGLWFKDPETNQIRFTSGEANNPFATQFNPSEPCPNGDPDFDYVAENGNTALIGFDRFGRLWKPEIISFKAPVNAALMGVIRAAHMPQIDAPQKYGYITVWDGLEYQQGYLLELRYKDADLTGELSTFRLIKKWDSPLALVLHVEFSDEFSEEFN